MKKLLKPLITSYKKINLYGDMNLTKDGYYFELRAKAIRVKILNLFWITYKYYPIK